jgi:hypothetical protein
MAGIADTRSVTTVPSSRLERVLSMTITASAVVVAALFARRELLSGPGSPAMPGDSDTTRYIENWQAYAAQGVRFGRLDAPVTVIEFMDFECPFCKRFALDMTILRKRFPDAVAVVVHHYPLRSHRFAALAARASMCAHTQGRFEAFHDLLFEKQDSIGLKDWAAFATEAELPEVSEFEQCRRQTGSVPAIDSGLAFGRAIGLRGTPTVILNGWKLSRTPTLEELESGVRAVLSGQAPIGGNAIRP